MNKKIDILELNDGDEVIFLNHLHEKYLIFYIGEKALYVPNQNELLVNLIKTICFKNESLRGSYIFRTHALVLLNGRMEFIKYGEKISSIMKVKSDVLFSGYPFVNILKVSVVQGKWKSYDGSEVLKTMIETDNFFNYENQVLFNKIRHMMNIYEKQIKKELLMNNFGFFLNELKKNDSYNIIYETLNKKIYAPIFRQYKLKTLGFDE